MTRLALAAAIALLVGCARYAAVTMVNAPGHTDLAKPVPNERGRPEVFEPATEPGAETYMVALLPTLNIGAGREELPRGHLAIELGIEARIERHTAADRDVIGLRNVGLTVGMGLAQIVGPLPTITGPLFAELNYRSSVFGFMPVDVGLGPVAYASEGDLGAQITLRYTMMAVRARYLAGSGFEVFGGITVPIPFFFSRSR